ncbi:hypothetical protein B0T11DRAFT_297450 [Plectosphaerella cucumerina]|uniref:Uncharacterized protein n=1 Tax=Plectosphaerella cucumerina TaxID=40658 RepID=A0A8K0TGB0_9PEZI|nr:hypothetical protein B0T11DRAFT_297450 [Plectosphaerella cucumerina]
MKPSQLTGGYRPTNTLHNDPRPSLEPRASTVNNTRGKRNAGNQDDGGKAPKRKRCDHCDVLVSGSNTDANTGMTTGAGLSEPVCTVRTNLQIEVSVRRPKASSELGLCEYNGPRGAYVETLALHFEEIPDDKQRTLYHSTLTAVEHSLWNAEDLYKRVRANGYTDVDCNAFFVASGLSWGGHRTEMQAKLTKERLDQYERILSQRKDMFDLGTLDWKSVMTHDRYTPVRPVEPKPPVCLAETLERLCQHEAIHGTTYDLQQVRSELARQDERRQYVEIELEEIRSENRRLYKTQIENRVVLEQNDARIGQLESQVRQLEQAKKDRDEEMKLMAAQHKVLAGQNMDLAAQHAVQAAQIKDLVEQVKMLRNKYK